jgi:hypothetical protein
MSKQRIMRAGKDPEHDLLRTAQRERAGLRNIFERSEGLPARRRAWLVSELVKVKPVLIMDKAGHRVPCEPAFKLTRRERRALVQAMVAERASRAAIRASLGISTAGSGGTWHRPQKASQMALECGEKLPFQDPGRGGRF